MSWLRDLKLGFDPFNAAVNRPEELYASKDLQRLEDAIVAAVFQRELLVVLGPRGAGKTTTLYHTMEQGPRGDLHIVRDIGIAIERLEIEHIVEAILRDLLTATRSTERIKHSRNARLHQLRRVLGEYARDHEVVLVLEDGHKFKPETLVNLKRLRELRFGLQERLLTIVILAQPQMRTLLQDYEEVLLRATVHELQGLEAEEVRAYIDCKLRRAGAKAAELFTPAALKQICATFHWPLEINYNGSRMLREAAEIGDVPISAELAAKYCSAQSALYSLFLLSGLEYMDLQRELERQKIHCDRSTIRRILHGRGTQRPELETALRTILSPRAGSMASLYDAVAPGLTASQRERIETLHVRMHDLGERFDLARTARDAHLSQRRTWDVLHGADLTETELRAVELALQRQTKAA